MSIWEGCVFLIGRICGALCGVCALYALCSGSTAAFSAALLDGIARAVQLAITLGGAMCFWGGILEAARRGFKAAVPRLPSAFFVFVSEMPQKSPSVRSSLRLLLRQFDRPRKRGDPPWHCRHARNGGAGGARMGKRRYDSFCRAQYHGFQPFAHKSALFAPRRRLRRPVFDSCPGLALLGDWLHLCRFPVPPACPPFPQPGKTASCTQRKSCGARKEALRHAGRI